jgi:DNA helicase-2/ATP-dependent DNA helicase PcrA
MLNLESPPIDDDQQHAEDVFQECGKVLIEAPPGTGKTFLGVHLATRAFLLGWVSRDKPALFLTFSRNARVQIEREIASFQEKGWATNEQMRAVKVSNFHAFYLEILRRKAGFWGCTEVLRPASISDHEQRLERLVRAAGIGSSDLPDAVSQASLALALQRFHLTDLLGRNAMSGLDENIMREAYKDATAALKEGRPHYDDFAPLFLHLLENSKELLHWLRTVYPVVILDEFQDTDAIQWEMIRRIRPPRLVALYDRYQMIYEWRGARADRIDQITQEFGITNRMEVQLTHVHRAEQQADLVRFILQLRVDDLKGTSVTAPMARDWLRTCPIRRWPNVTESQWRMIPDQAKCLTSLRYGRVVDHDESTAILTRANYLADFLYDNLRVRKDQSPCYRCRWIGGENNPDEKIRDQISRLRRVDAPLELRAWLGSLLDDLMPRRFLSDLSFAAEFNCTGDNLLKRRRKPSLQAMRQKLLAWWDSVNPSNLPAFAQILRLMPGLGEELLGKEGYLDPDSLYYLRELAEAAETYTDTTQGGNWKDFCDYLEDRLVRSVFVKLRFVPKGLYILTVHQSKGREFDHVIVPWLSARGEPRETQTGGVFPLEYNYHNLEDRRLLYVALTRARRRVTIVYPAEDPSPFIARWRLGE